MQKTKNILYGFHDDDLETFIKRALQAQGYQVISAVKYGISAIIQYATENPVNAIIMRCKTEAELEKARDLRDLNTTLILLVTASMRGTPEMEEALSSGLNNIVFAGLHSHSKSLRTEIVDIIREERSQKQARIYYGFAPLERPACFSGEFSVRNEQQLLMLYEYLLDRTDERKLEVRFEKVLGMLPAGERHEMAAALPAPIKALLQDSESYQNALISEKKKRGFFSKNRKGTEESEEENAELALTGSKHLMDTINQLVERYHKHQFGEWELVRPATDQDEGEECRCCMCGYKESRKIPKTVSKKIVPAEVESDWGPEQRTEPTCETDGKVFRINSEGEIQNLYELPRLGHLQDEQVEKEADCIHEGQVTCTCTRCGKKMGQKVIPPTGQHKWSDWTVELAATCSMEGKQIRTCSICGQKETQLIPAEKQHCFSEWEIVKQAACEEPGRRIRRCSVCGKEELEDVPELGHEYEKVVYKEATCSQPGSYILKCLRCGSVQEQNEVIPPTGDHTFSEWEVEKKASCTEEGVRIRHCTVCGQIQKETIPAEEHTFQKVIVKEPTCTEEGYYDMQCSQCGQVQGNPETIAPTGKHTFSEWMTVRPATCQEEGMEERHCTVCGQKDTRSIAQMQHKYQKVIGQKAACQKDGYYNLRCIYCGDLKKNAGTLSAAKEHIPIKRLIQGASCTQPGRIEVRCAICGKTTIEVIKASHQPIGKGICLREATCTNEGEIENTCAVCGKKYKESIPCTHAYGKWKRIQAGETCADSDIFKRTCKLCGKLEQEKRPSNKPHNYEWFVENEASCEHDGREIELCTVCGVSKKPKKIMALGHQYTGPIHTEPTCIAEGEIYQTCLRCKKKKQIEVLAPTGHDLQKETIAAPTCLEAGKYRVVCRKCQMVAEEGTIEPLGHSYGPVVETDATCTEPGQSCRTCQRCGEVEVQRTVPMLGHTPQKKILLPESCTEVGKYQMICSRCSQPLSEIEFMPKLGHDFSEWTVVQEADCQHAGEEMRKCNRCGIEETRSIEKLAHVWEKKVIPSTCVTEGYEERVCLKCKKVERLETLPLSVHMFGKWKKAGFQDIRTCEVCGETEKRLAYKRIALTSIGGVLIAGSTCAGILLATGTLDGLKDNTYLENKPHQSAEPWSDEEAQTIQSSKEPEFETGQTESEEENTEAMYESVSAADIPEEPDASEYGKITELFELIPADYSESLKKIQEEWEKRKDRLSLKPGILGEPQTYVVTQADLQAAVQKILNATEPWANNTQNLKELHAPEETIPETDEIGEGEAETQGTNE